MTVTTDDARRHLRQLRNHPLGLERMEAELLEMFREWHQEQRKDLTWGDSPTPRS